MLPSVVSEQGVDAVDAILDRWIGARHPEAGPVAIRVLAKEFLYDLPVGARRRSPALLAGGVAVDGYIEQRRFELRGESIVITPAASGKGSARVSRAAVHFRVRARKSSQAAQVLESGRISSSKMRTFAVVHLGQAPSTGDWY